MTHYQSILPEFDVFKAPGPVRAPPGGQMLGRVPTRAAEFILNPGLTAMRGLGQDETAPIAPPAAMAPTREIGTVAAIGVIAVVGAIGYQIGKAMTPSGGKEMTWALVGIPVTLFTGPLGLGVMALYANYGRH
jgi:hypothetical protein